MITKGQKINERYEIVRTIGEGGMANVYLAHDIILDRDVAVKVLRGDLANDEKFVRRFQREAISASSLSHPNIVEMYDVGEDQGQYYIVMEYVNGKTLKNLIKKRGALTLPEVMDIMLQLTSGIACAHDSYIIHRDIKPQNVLILDDGMVKITDFGIAMALNSHELTQTNSVMGSVHYLPPEQANGSGSTIKSDIYSLGILMFELLTGKVPFKGENAVEIAIKQMKDQIPSVTRINNDIPQSIENIILRACAKNPLNRYDSIRQMYDDIKTCLNPEKRNEKRVNYKFPEQEVEKTKKLPSLAKMLNNNKKEGDEKPMSSKKINKLLVIATLVFLGLAVLIGTIVIIYPMLAKVPEVKVPDVSNLTTVAAEQKLEKLGLKVSSNDEIKPSDVVKEGNVISTKPESGRSIKKGQTIILIVSSGTQKVTLEDYTNGNFYTIEALLKASGIVVNKEKKDVTDATGLKEYTILEQKPAVGTVLSSGDSITLYVPNIVLEYPDFVGDGWMLDQATAFLTQYKITPTIEYEVSTSVEPGKILYQSRAAGSMITTGAYIKLKIAAAPSDTSPNEEVITY